MTAFHETAPAGPTAALAARMQALVPQIRTARLTLRAPRIEDFADFARIVLGPQGRHYGAPADRDAAWREFVQITGTWLLRGHGAWTVTDRETGDLLGFVHVGAEPGDREPELGFLVSQAAEGKGIAHEAARAVRDHALGAFGLPSLVSYVDPGNARSRRLAERLGAVPDPAGDPPDCIVYRHHPPEAAR